jgi:DNA-binding PucR family transcriptional regulator
VRRLLDGELLDPSNLEYPIALHHVGVIASGPDAAYAVRGLASALDRCLLLVRASEVTMWGWLGGRRKLSQERLLRHADELRPREVILAFGDHVEGLAGWRLTHRQASAAFRVAKEGEESVVSYPDVALLATALQDSVLADSLRHRIYPVLEDPGTGGPEMRRTLQAYLAHGRNTTSAAAALNVSRSTVAARLRLLEEQLGTLLSAQTAEIEIALRLLEFEEQLETQRPEMLRTDAKVA